MISTLFPNRRSIKSLTRSSAHGENLSILQVPENRDGQQVGSVQVLYQRFGDSVLLVTTRSPHRTEDVDFSIGMTIMAEGHRWFPHVAVVDAHNCMTDLSSPVLLATLTATEYQKAAVDAMEACRTAPQFPFRVGVAHHTLPYSREMGFGDLGIQVLVIDVEGQRTAYVLIDGNNMALGAREILLDEILRVCRRC